MKALRYFIFIPIIFLLIALVYILLPWSLFALMSFSKFWLIMFLIFFGGLAIVIFQILPGIVTWLSSKISPSQHFAFYTVLLISLLFAIVQITGFWINPDLSQDGFGVFLKILLTCLTIGIGMSLSVGAGIELYDTKKRVFEIFLAVGTIVFYIGIFLAFCLLSTKICVIKADKNYNWYSGIWHGIFVIPHWVVSWFSDDILCKAQNATVGYRIWWWISFIFFGLSILGGSSSSRNEN